MDSFYLLSLRGQGSILYVDTKTVSHGGHKGLDRGHGENFKIRSSSR